MLWPPQVIGLPGKVQAKARAQRSGTPLYRRGWFWGLTGVGTVGLALGLGLGLSLPNIPSSHQTVIWNH